MFKYCYEGQVHEAKGPKEAFAASNLLMPEPEDPSNYFLVRVLMWHEPDDEYTVEKIDGCGHRVFDEYNDALPYFRFVQKGDVLNPSEDVKLQLVHVVHGDARPIHSKIILPSVLMQEP